MFQLKSYVLENSTKRTIPLSKNVHTVSSRIIGTLYKHEGKRLNIISTDNNLYVCVGTKQKTQETSSEIFACGYIKHIFVDRVTGCSSAPSSLFLCWSSALRTSFTLSLSLHASSLFPSAAPSSAPVGHVATRGTGKVLREFSYENANYWQVSRKFQDNFKQNIFIYLTIIIKYH